MSLIEPAQVSQLRQAAQVLRDLHDDGYIDWSVKGTPDLEGLADQLDAFLSTYSGVERAASVRLGVVT